MYASQMRRNKFTTYVGLRNNKAKYLALLWKRTVYSNDCIRCYDNFLEKLGFINFQRIGQRRDHFEFMHIYLSKWCVGRLTRMASSFRLISASRVLTSVSNSETRSRARVCLWTRSSRSRINCLLDVSRSSMHVSSFALSLLASSTVALNEVEQ